MNTGIDAIHTVSPDLFGAITERKTNYFPWEVVFYLSKEVNVIMFSLKSNLQ